MAEEHPSNDFIRLEVDRLSGIHERAEKLRKTVPQIGQVAVTESEIVKMEPNLGQDPAAVQARRAFRMRHATDQDREGIEAVLGMEGTADG